MTSTTSKIFKSIKLFVDQLDSVFGQKQRSLKLYQYLLSKTELKNRKSVKKHIKVFRIFCDKNKTQILNKDENLVYSKIIYSDKVQIDVQTILHNADSNTKKVIWEHLLCICAKLSPDSEARNILKASFKDKTPENDFLQNIMGEVQSHITPNAGANPMQLIGSLLQSNTIGKLISGMNDGVSSGQLDMKKLLGSVQGMISNLSDKLPDSKEVKTLQKTVQKASEGGDMTEMLKDVSKLAQDVSVKASKESDSDCKTGHCSLNTVEEGLAHITENLETSPDVLSPKGEQNEDENDLENLNGEELEILDELETSDNSQKVEEIEAGDQESSN